MSCPTKQSGQGMYRNGKPPAVHRLNPISARNNKKRKYHNASLAAKRFDLLELTKDWLDLTTEEVEMYLENEWHDADNGVPQSAGCTEWIVDSNLEETPREESNG